MNDRTLEMELRDAMLEAYSRKLRELRMAREISEAQADKFDRAHIKIIVPLDNVER